MKYTTEIILDLPHDRVVQLFDNPDNLAKWQIGLQSFEHVSGELGKPGAKSRLLYDMGGRKVEMTETIEARSLPEEFSGTYEADGVWNGLSNRFYDEGDQTRWEIETEFKFSGWMRLLSFFMRGSFPKQTMETMQQFKRFAESQ
jgi:hypothetical protein